MSAKYYTHFVSQETDALTYDEYHGVVELNTRSQRIADEREIAQVLARSFDLEEDEIKVLQWQRLH